MRTLLYFRTHLDDPANTGVGDKCRAIAAAFGPETDTWYFHREGLRHESGSDGLNWSAPKYSLRHLLLYYFLADWHLMRTVDFNQYQLFYIRHLPAHPLFIQLLKKARRQNPQLKIVIELPTWPYDAEASGIVAKTAAISDRFFRKKMGKYIDRFVHFGAEKEIWGVPTISMSNGIDVAQKPIRHWQKSLDGTLRLLAVGSWSAGHGLDRILYGMKEYTQKGGKVSLTVSGAGPGIPALIALARELQLEHLIRFLPPTQGPSYDALFDQSDVAIGGLAIHRKGIKEASPLRHRDYCARGIPFVLAGKDSDIAVDWPFCLQIPEGDAPVDLIEVQHFWDSLQKEHPHFTQEMRTFAQNQLDWKVKIKPLITLGTTFYDNH